MKYAVIKTGGKQYRVSEGDQLEVEHLSTEGKKVDFTDVLLYVEDGSVKVGTPHVAGVVVKATLDGDIRGKKIRVAKFKSKVRYRRVTGHRQSLSKVTIDSIELASKSKK